MTNQEYRATQQAVHAAASRADEDEIKRLTERLEKEDQQRAKQKDKES